ncbi:B56-domain-containing protein [Ramicandelaber brevisporus]|nr:B56-domain-containing protein [Ramicandelaber brevisporus]
MYGHRTLYGAASPSVLRALPSLRNVSEKQRETVAIDKLRQCRVIFDFTDDSQFVEDREIKYEALVDILDFIGNYRGGQFSDSLHHEIIYMCAANLLRTLSPPRNPRGPQYDPEEDEPTLESGWNHIQLVYQIFLRFIESPSFSASIAKRYVDQRFALQLLELFESEDPRERDFAKTTMHRIYGKFLGLRSCIRRAIGHTFMRYTYEYEDFTHNGISELLEILGSIINGFAQPLKQEHVTFLEKTLLPLHKVPSLHVFHPQLSYCIVQYTDKEPALAGLIIKSLLKMWPQYNSNKGVLFLSEIEDVLDLAGSDQWREVAVVLSKKLAQCITCQHFQVIERALAFFRNDKIIEMIRSNLENVMPIIIPALVNRSQSCWNRNVQVMAINVVRMFQDLSPDAVDACMIQAKQLAEFDLLDSKKRVDSWNNIRKEAARLYSPNMSISPNLFELETFVSPQQQQSPSDVEMHNTMSASTNATNESQQQQQQLPPLPPPPLPLPPTSTVSAPPGGTFGRRKSVLPVDEQILDELAQHKPLEEIISGVSRSLLSQPVSATPPLSPTNNQSNGPSISAIRQTPNGTSAQQQQPIADLLRYALEPMQSNPRA